MRMLSEDTDGMLASEKMKIKLLEAGAKKNLNKEEEQDRVRKLNLIEKVRESKSTNFLFRCDENQLKKRKTVHDDIAIELVLGLRKQDVLALRDD